MSPETISVVVVLLVGFSLLAWIIRSEIGKLSHGQNDASMAQWLASMQRSIDSQTNTVSARLDTAARVVGDLRQSLGEMSEVGRGIRSLQEFLQSPKLRGNIGEQVLRDMVSQMFPKHALHFQYRFRSGVKVDMAIETDAGLLCVDSKFPMENYARMHAGETDAGRAGARKEFAGDVRRHIDDIAGKYILPDEGTMDFALMYIPSESVYYEIVTMPDVMEYARAARVFPVSPTTLYAHLQVILQSFQGKELEARTREVFTLIRAIRKDYEKTGEQLGVLGRHVGNAYNAMNAVAGSYSLLGDKLARTEGIGSTGRGRKLPDPEN